MDREERVKAHFKKGGHGYRAYTEKDVKLRCNYWEDFEGDWDELKYDDNWSTTFRYICWKTDNRIYFINIITCPSKIFIKPQICI